MTATRVISVRSTDLPGRSSVDPHHVHQTAQVGEEKEQEQEQKNGNNCLGTDDARWENVFSHGT